MGLYPPPTQQEAVTPVSAVHCFLMTAKLTSPSNKHNWNLCALTFVHFAVFSWHANFFHLAKKQNKNSKKKLQSPNECNWNLCAIAFVHYYCFLVACKLFPSCKEKMSTIIQWMQTEICASSLYHICSFNRILNPPLLLAMADMTIL